MSDLDYVFGDTRSLKEEELFTSLSFEFFGVPPKIVENERGSCSPPSFYRLL